MTAPTQRSQDAGAGDPNGPLLLVSPDEYLLELEREDVVARWSSDHPDGEVVRLEPAPTPEELVRELVNPSLFAPVRLVVIPNARPYYPTPRRKKAVQDEEGEATPANGEAEEEPADSRGDRVARALEGLSFSRCSLLVTLVSNQMPKGALTDLVSRVGSARFLAVPQQPKPWEQGRVSREQREVLRAVVARRVPAVAADTEVLDALCESFGFHVRDFVLAAERLQAGGVISGDAVRAQVGAGDCSMRRLEDALIARDRAAAARFLGVLSAGGVLVDWRDEPIPPGGVGPVLTATLGRLLRGALAARLHARCCGLEVEMDPAQCSADFWYQRVFKTRLHERLAGEIARHEDSPLAGASQWQLHRAFRLGAAHDEAALIAALAALARLGVERAPAQEAVAALTPLLLRLTDPRPPARTVAAPTAPRQRSSRARRV